MKNARCADLNMHAQLCGEDKTSITVVLQQTLHFTILLKQNRLNIPKVHETENR
jgi:hypothetical protein